jgi:hypothetical protein
MTAAAAATPSALARGLSAAASASTATSSARNIGSLSTMV